LEVYPNPTNGILQINGIENGQLRVFSLTGQLVYDTFYHKGDEIDLTTVKQACISFRCIHREVNSLKR
jgi:hypothetical protein